MTSRKDQQRIDALVELGGTLLFFAQQGLIQSGSVKPGDLMAGLAQAAILAGVNMDDWGAINAACRKFDQDVAGIAEDRDEDA